jgi:SOS response regulatory protein OraA/RecX
MRAVVRRFRSVGVKKDVSSKIRHWCALSERSPEQVRRKLLSWGAWERAEAEAWIEQLKAEGYVDETRFSEAFAVDHVKLKGWGPGKVKAALRQVHRLDDHVVERALACVSEEDVRDAARRAVRRRLLGRGGEDKSKTLGSLLGLGFDLELARLAVEEATDDRKFDATW